MTSKQKWYYQLMTEEFGPVSLDQLKLMIDDHVLSSSDQVRTEDSDGWIPVSKLLNDSAVLQDKASEQDIAGSDVSPEEPDINDFQLHGDSESPPVHGSSRDSSELDINAFQVQGDSDSPLPVQPAPRGDAPETKEKADCWFAQSLGQTFGPMAFSEILEMVRNGLLSHGDQIQETHDGEWQPVESRPELANVLAELPPAVQEHGALSASETKPQAAVPKKKKLRPRQPNAESDAPPAPAKKRRKKKEDPLLKEIFSEVFTKDGQVREDMLRSSSTSSAPAVADSQSASAASPTAASLPGASTEDGALTHSVSSSSGPPTASITPPMQPAAPPQPAPPQAYTPPARPPARKSSSGGGFQMPEPKTLGIIGGGLALVAILVLGFMGILPIPGFGVDPESFLKDFAAQYEKVKTGSASEWAALREDYGPTARELARSLATSVGSDPAAKRYQQAALLVVRLVAVAHDDKEKQAEIYGDFNQAMTGGG